MRRMITNKQIGYIDNLSKNVTLENEGSTLKLNDNSIQLFAPKGSINLANLTLSGHDGEGVVQLSADTQYGMFGCYSEDAGDYLYAISINEDGIQLQVLDDNSGDYVSYITLTTQGLILSIPTSDPEVEGALWNDNGTLKISAGE